MLIKIKGRDYPIKATMYALLQFKRDRGVQVAEISDGDVEEMLYYTWLCVKGACMQAGVEFECSFEEYINYVEGDPMEALLEDKAEEIKKKAVKS